MGIFVTFREAARRIRHKQEYAALSVSCAVVLGKAQRLTALVRSMYL